MGLYQNSDQYCDQRPTEKILSGSLQTAKTYKSKSIAS